MSEDFSDRGLEIRREVMGAKRVESFLQQADDFARPLQELMTSFAWGQVWAREEHLDRRARSLITISLLLALNRPTELEAHFQAGLNNGLTESELRELIIHSAVYCGFPAALEATRVAQRVLTKK